MMIRVAIVLMIMITRQFVEIILYIVVQGFKLCVFFVFFENNLSQWSQKTETIMLNYPKICVQFVFVLAEP